MIGYTSRRLYSLLGTLLLVTFIFTIFSLTSVPTVSAMQGLPGNQIESIPLGCGCHNYNLNLWECCDHLYWHEENGGWYECQGSWHYEWYLPPGCSVL